MKWWSRAINWPMIWFRKMNSTYLIYSSLIIRSSHMSFNTNLPIKYASHRRTCHWWIHASLSWHLRNGEKMCVTFIHYFVKWICSKEQELSMLLKHAIVVIKGVQIFFQPFLDAFFFCIPSIPDIPAPLACPGLCMNSLGECGNMAHSRSLSKALNPCPAQQMARADFAFTKGQFTDISHFPTIISIASVVV